jgi:hypothetical protein
MLERSYSLPELGYRGHSTGRLPGLDIEELPALRASTLAPRFTRNGTLIRVRVRERLRAIVPRVGLLDLVSQD